MNANELRKRFLEFFEKRGHAVLPSASLVPENDPSALFTTAGVQPLVPYILQGSHPQGRRLASVQKCVRTTDIDDVGDKTHATFFEMMGNWSIGDYFKKEAIEMSFTFLTSKEEGLGLDLNRLYVTVFEGSDTVPRDEEAVEFWKKVGMPENRIYFRGAENFWNAGENGPCGPSTEMFYDLTTLGLGDLSPEEFEQADENQKIVEIWNDVFMEYLRENGKVVGKLPSKNVDTGSGFERMLTVLQKKDSIFETDVFESLITETAKISDDMRSQRIIADHFRTAIFMIADGVMPSNTDRGYVLRRLIRRAVMHSKNNIFNHVDTLVGLVVETYSNAYPEVKLNSTEITKTILLEVKKFENTLQQGLKQFEKIKEQTISGEEAFILFSSYGFPFEITKELAAKKGKTVDEAGFTAELKTHQEKSRTASAGKFKGGLGGHSEQEIKYHTATHLLNAALRKVLGDHVGQKGSNINAERLRFDFSHGEKLTDEQKTEVEKLVNEAIAADYPVTVKETSLQAAHDEGAVGVFGEKYPETVKVYTIGDDSKPWSREICGGPHVPHTSLLGHFKIKKEEAVAQGVRRIKAVLD